MSESLRNINYIKVRINRSLRQSAADTHVIFPLPPPQGRRYLHVFSPADRLHTTLRDAIQIFCDTLKNCI